MNAEQSLGRWPLGRTLLLGLAVAGFFVVGNAGRPDDKGPKENALSSAIKPADCLTCRPRPEATPVPQVKVGEEIRTDAGQRRRVVLDGGVELYVNENTRCKYAGKDLLQLDAGEVYVDVPHRKNGVFAVRTPRREADTRHGKFAVRNDGKGASVIVTRGVVKVSAQDKVIAVAAGQELARNSVTPAPLPRASHVLDWTRDLMAAAVSPLVPASQHAGGSLVAVDPQGQEAKITLRKFHIDVFIEDGFARTTIDQTYFNHESSQLEGTFYFPLPPDASLSRLAMYVDGTLMEGGMAERDYARQVYETIRYANRDPALLEWVDGSTFKMRVFPLEPRQEKRIVLSYTQRLPSLYGKTEYRFPAGHSMQKVDLWSFHARVKNGAEMTWTSPSHPPGFTGIKAKNDGNDLILDASARFARTDKDVILSLTEKDKKDEAARFFSTVHDGSEYLMVRYRPTLKIGDPEAKSRNRLWVFLFESSGDRDPLLGRAQVEVIRNFLTHVDPNDKFLVAAAGTRVRFHAAKPQAASANNVKAAMEFLENTHLIGALDLANAFAEINKVLPEKRAETYLVHVGSGIPAMGERRDDALIKALPEALWLFGPRDPITQERPKLLLAEAAHYVGVGVGKRWNRTFMKAAAEKTGGHFTQINPDEPIAWRAFDLFATLHTPRLMNVEVVADDGQTQVLGKDGKTVETARPLLLAFNQTIAQGEEICALTRVGKPRGESSSPGGPAGRIALPTSIRIRGTLDGKAAEFPLKADNVHARADYLPRTWAKLEIDRLLADNALANKDTIINLSKAMYVMTPFTSLLVLEHEDLYTQYKVDRGRKDHWAMYDCPAKIPVVYEPEPGQPDLKKMKGKLPAKEVVKTVLARQHLRFLKEQEKGMEIVFADIREMKDLYGWRGYPIESRNEFGPPMLSKIPHLDRFFGSVVFKDRETQILSGQFQPPFGGFPGPDLADKRAGVTQAHPGDAAFFARSFRKSDPFSGTDFDPAKKEFDKDIFYRADRIGEVSVPGMEKLPPLLEPLGIAPEGREGKSSRGLKLSKADPVADLVIPVANFPFADLPDRPGERASLLYQRPGYAGDDRIFYDLVAYAPGMNTSRADIAAVLDAEAIPQGWIIRSSLIDASARDLIDKANLPGWHTLTIPVGQVSNLSNQSGQVKNLSYEITFDGSGRYVYERTLPPGIKEQVVCDGKTLLHLYPQLKIGARREVSRFHRADFAAVAPWVLPPVDDLAKGHDLKLIGERTVAVVPHFEGKIWPRRKSHWANPEKFFEVLAKGRDHFLISETTDLRNDLLRFAEVRKILDGKIGREQFLDFAKIVLAHDPAFNAEWLRVHLVFAENGRLAERQWLHFPKGELAYRQILAADGTIRLVDAKGKELAVRKGKLTPSATPPDLAPKTDSLVVLPLPYRSADHVRKTLKLEKKNLQDLRLAEALPLFAAYVGANNGGEAHTVFQRCFRARDQNQLGFYVLLAACGVNLDAQNADVLAEHLDEPLAQYLALHSSPVLRKHASQWAVSSASFKEGFLQHLATTHALYQRWQSDKVTQGDPARFKTDRARAFDYVKKHKDSIFGWCLACLMEDRNVKLALPDKKGYIPDPEYYRELAEAFRLFADSPALGYAARYEEARCLLKAGRRDEAKKRFHDLYAQTFKDDVLPAIDGDFRRALLGQKGEADWWSEQLGRTAKKLVLDKRRPAVFTLAWQCWQLDDQPLANTLFAAALTQLDAKEKNALTLAGIHFLWQTNQVAHADELLQKLAGDKELAGQPGLWRLGVKFAEHRDMTARGLDSLEKALDAEFHKLPPVISLDSVRAEYGKLLDHYAKLADAMITLKASPPPDFLAKVVRAADRWRALDRDNSDPCTRAAWILQRLGQRELGWDYLTTPIALKPAEAEPWLTLASHLGRKGDLDLADRAFKAASEAEPTNAQILWDRAQNLRRLGKTVEAQALFRRIADGVWQPRFQGLVNQARGQLQGP